MLPRPLTHLDKTCDVLGDIVHVLHDLPLEQGHEVSVVESKLQHVVGNVGQGQNVSIIQMVDQQLADFLVQLETHASMKLSKTNPILSMYIRYYLLSVLLLEVRSINKIDT